MKHLIFLLITLPFLASCSSDSDDDPTFVIDPVEPITETRLQDMLLNAQGVEFAMTSEPFNALHDAIDTSGQYEIDTPYDYPNKPGYGSGWNDLAPEEDNLAKTQVPQDVAEKMTTRALVETCINHPMTMHYLRGEGYYRAFIQRLIEQNNAFKELTKRPDAGWEIAIAYNNLPLPSAEAEIGAYNFRTWGFVELMLDNDIFFSQLTSLQRVDLYKALCVKYFYKEQNYPYGFSLEPTDIGLTLLPMAKVVLQIAHFVNDDSKKFLENYVESWDCFKTTSTDVLLAIALMTGSDLKAYEEINIGDNLDKLLGTWKVISSGWFGHWRDYEEESVFTFMGNGVVDISNWRRLDKSCSYTIQGNVISIVTGDKDEGGNGIDFGMKVVVLTGDRLECWAYTTWPLSSWGGEWFVLKKK